MQTTYLVICKIDIPILMEYRKYFEIKKESGFLEEIVSDT